MTVRGIRVVSHIVRPRREDAGALTGLEHVPHILFLVTFLEILVESAHALSNSLRVGDAQLESKISLRPSVVGREALGCVLGHRQ